MKTYKSQSVKVVDQTICDICAKTCTDDFYNHENATLEAYWGYSSSTDGSQYEIHLCEQCFYDTVKWMKDKRAEYFNEEPDTLKYYPFEGKSSRIV